MNWENTLRSAIGVLAISALAACGGGGGGGDGDSDSGGGSVDAGTAEGLYTGTTGNGQTLTGLVLDNGNYWVLYSDVNSSAIDGVIQGSSSSNNGNFTSSNGRDFNFGAYGISDLTIAGTYVAKQSIAGNLNYGGAKPTTFNASYDARYTQPATLANIAGSYSGQSATAGENEGANFTVSATGAISGSGASGCRFTGSVAPRGNVAAYDLTLSFMGGICEQGTATITGIAYMEPGSNRLLAAALDSTRRNGAVFIGEKAATSVMN